MLRAREPVFHWKKKTTIYPIESSHSEIYKDRVNVLRIGHVVFIYLEIYSFLKKKIIMWEKAKGLHLQDWRKEKEKGYDAIVFWS